MTDRIDDELEDLLYEDEEQTPEEEPIEEPTGGEEVQVPPAYQGKTIEELVQMNLEAQRQISRQGNEIGELRKFTDEYLKQALEPVEEDSLYEDPLEAAENLVTKKIKPIEDKLEQELRQRQLQAFESKHPDWRNHANDPAFQKWVAASKFRTRMYQQADAMDFDAADDLFTEWEEARESIQEATEAEKSEAMRAGSMESRPGRGRAKKVYSRADLIKLRMNDPEKYARHAEEIRLAYLEGRVK